MSGEHLALMYADEDEYVAGIARFVAPGREAGDPVAIAVPAERHHLVRPLLDGIADTELLDMRELGRNPGRIIGAVHDMLARRPGRTLHYVGEPIWAGRTDDEILEATRHEALINHAFEGASIRVLCPYDTRSLPREIVADACCTHPILTDGEGDRPSEHYNLDVPAHCHAPLPDPPPEATALEFSVGDLAQLRRVIVEEAGTALGPARAADLLLAVNELATNTVRHAGGKGILRVWRDHGRLTFEVQDRGYIADPLVGRMPPPAASLGSRGLWLVNQLCDLVQLRTGRDGTVIRVHAVA